MWSYESLFPVLTFLFITGMTICVVISCCYFSAVYSMYNAHGWCVILFLFLLSSQRHDSLNVWKYYVKVSSLFYEICINLNIFKTNYIYNLMFVVCLETLWSMLCRHYDNNCSSWFTVHTFWISENRPCRSHSFLQTPITQGFKAC